MGTRWLGEAQLAAWLPLIAVVERLPTVLDAQLRRDAGLTHFEYMVLAMLSEADGATLQMTDLARRTDATLPRLSHVVARLEARGAVTRSTSPTDRRATVVTLTDAGGDVVRAAAPGHVAQVRRSVFDVLDEEQVEQLRGIASAVLARLEEDGRQPRRTVGGSVRQDAEPPAEPPANPPANPPSSATGPGRPSR
ncbi:MarR family winged helix-turn-helix transcriptional regulator [Cellulomonas marina]|uniref:DNA-binding transcriptional regulator, MarR family n=1 Tax=Cellulomonas marina TaxID=988821 RepID=A0A1I0Z162_9CELL|nr:MarR family transcriptional regulator [Cellulomonas marina]GIG28166.1 MarR family transcriptional regulator [Cellulomonas marina]SFB19281.1 DNA-binding transcriptional regulator, MarR family [Cellulomonas marina]